MPSIHHIQTLQVNMPMLLHLFNQKTKAYPCDTKLRVEQNSALLCLIYVKESHKLEYGIKSIESTQLSYVNETGVVSVPSCMYLYLLAGNNSHLYSVLCVQKFDWNLEHINHLNDCITTYIWNNKIVLLSEVVLLVLQ